MVDQCHCRLLDIPDTNRGLCGGSFPVWFGVVGLRELVFHGYLIQECHPYLSRLLRLWFRCEALPLYEIHNAIVEFPFCYTNFPEREFYAVVKNSLL